MGMESGVQEAMNKEELRAFWDHFLDNIDTVSGEEWSKALEFSKEWYT